MPPLGAKERAQLPDSAFAYIDSRGRRRLPINDASHVRNALSRFNQVAFEDEGARDRARLRLLRAAKKHGIMPIGFLGGQLSPQRKLPKGDVTFLLTDLEGSTDLLRQLDDRYAALLADVRRKVRAAVRQAGGREVDARADDLFAVFESAGGALEAAARDSAGDAGGPLARRGRRAASHRDPSRPSYADRHGLRRACRPRCRAHLQLGARRPAVVSAAARTAAVESSSQTGSPCRPLGAWRFQGLPEPVELFQLHARDLRVDFPPPRSAVSAGRETTGTQTRFAF